MIVGRQFGEECIQICVEPGIKRCVVVQNRSVITDARNGIASGNRRRNREVQVLCDDVEVREVDRCQYIRPLVLRIRVQIRCAVLFVQAAVIVERGDTQRFAGQIGIHGVGRFEVPFREPFCGAPDRGIGSVFADRSDQSRAHLNDRFAVVRSSRDADFPEAFR